jgi:predicted RNA methylase
MTLCNRLHELYEAVEEASKDMLERGEISDGVATQCLNDYSRSISLMRLIADNTASNSNAIDAGAGTGILSLAFLAGGGRRVYALEMDPEFVEFLHHIARITGYSRRLVPVQCDTTKYRPKMEADFIFAEQVQTGFTEEDQIQTVINLRKSLRPGGRLFPERGTSTLTVMEGNRCLSQPVVYDTVDMYTINRAALQKKTELELQQTGTPEWLKLSTVLSFGSTQLTGFRTLCSDYSVQYPWHGMRKQSFNKGSRLEIQINYCYGSYVTSLDFSHAGCKAPRTANRII